MDHVRGGILGIRGKNFAARLQTRNGLINSNLVGNMPKDGNLD